MIRTNKLKLYYWSIYTTQRYGIAPNSLHLSLGSCPAWHVFMRYNSFKTGSRSVTHRSENGLATMRVDIVC